MIYQKTIFLVLLMMSVVLNACGSTRPGNNSSQRPDETKMAEEMAAIFDAEPTVTITPFHYKTASFGQTLSIDYPDSWHILEESGLVVFSPKPVNKTQYLSGSPNWFLVGYRSSDASSGASEADLQNFMDAGHLEIKGQITNLIVDGRTAYKANYESTSAKGWVVLTTNNDNQQAVITAKGEPHSSPVSSGWDDYESIYEHMLSSIRFN